MEFTDHNNIFADSGTPSINDARISIKPDHNQPSINAIVDASIHSVGADFISTMHGVASYADSGATRAVVRHLGPAQGYQPSTAPTLIRAGEFQSLRASGTEGGIWGLEVGVHSQVQGDGWSKNVGIYLASSHGGWLPSGVKNDTAILVTGEDGWNRVLLHTGTNGAWLYRIDGDGSTWMNGYLDMPNLPFFCAQVTGICNSGQDAIINPLSVHGMIHDNGGSGGGSRIFIPRDGTYEISFSVNSLDNNTQVLVTKNGSSLQWGGSSNAGNQISGSSLVLKCVVGDFITLRCYNGRFGGNVAFSNFSVRKVG